MAEGVHYWFGMNGPSAIAYEPDGFQGPLPGFWPSQPVHEYPGDRSQDYSHTHPGDYSEFRPWPEQRYMLNACGDLFGKC